VFSPLIVLTKNLSGFLEEETLLLRLSAITTEKEVRHVGGNGLSSINKEERGITNRIFWIYPIVGL
jgi:hypothetical protein